MGARIYNPKTGRFLSVDPVDGGSANAYDYVSQDPLGSLDLDGLQRYDKDCIKWAKKHGGKGNIWDSKYRSCRNGKRKAAEINWNREQERKARCRVASTVVSILGWQKFTARVFKMLPKRVQNKLDDGVFVGGLVTGNFLC